MKKKGKILAGLIVGCLGVTMLTSCSLSSEQNANVDNLLNKGDTLLDSLSDSLEKGNSLIDALDEKLNSSNAINISKDEAIVTLQNALFNLKYRINGCEITEGHISAKDIITNIDYEYQVITDTSTDIKKQFAYGYPYFGPDAEPSTSVRKYNTKDETGYRYYKELNQLEEETNINTFYTDLFGLGSPNLESIKDCITKAEKVNGEYYISIHQISQRSETRRNLLNYTTKIIDNKITNITITSVDETINEHTLPTTYDVERIMTFNYEIKYGSDVDLATLENAISEVDEKIEAAELLNTINSNFSNHTNGFEKFEVNLTQTFIDDKISINSKIICDHSTEIKKTYVNTPFVYDGDIAIADHISVFKRNINTGDSGYTYYKTTYPETSSSQEEVYEGLYQATNDSSILYSIFLEEFKNLNITSFIKENDAYTIKIKYTETNIDFDSYHTRITCYATYKIKNSRFTDVSLIYTAEYSETLSDKIDEFGNAYLENPTETISTTLSANFEYENIDLKTLNDTIAEIDKKIENGDIEYKEY